MTFSPRSFSLAGPNGAEPDAPHGTALTKPFAIGRAVKITYGLALAGSLVMGLLSLLAAVGSDPNRPDIVDFHAFMAAGHLAAEGRFADAYQISIMLALERALGGGRTIFMPWSYPPLFGLVVAPLSNLPLGLAYLSFVSITLGAYLAALRRLDAGALWPALLAGAPAILINIRGGQNGLLTGALFAAGALYLLERKPLRAGAAIACLAIKPHLALMLPLLMILRRQGWAFMAAAVGAAGLTGLSIAIFKLPTLYAFLASLSDVRRFMALGVYPLNRMTSLYACALSFGLPAPAAIALHGAAALAIVILTARAIRAVADLRLAIGLAVMASLFLSPYCYDYDQTIFTAGLILVAPTLWRHLSPRPFGCMLAAIAASQAMGIILSAIGSALSPSGAILVVVYAIILRVLTAGPLAPAPNAL